jgi:DNA-binding MarR family transcriptional regulator
MGRHRSSLAKCVEDVRRFNRFYTSKIGVLERDYLGTRHSLTEARVIYELSLRAACTASDVARFLEVDTGYLSRLLESLERSAVISRSQSSADRREFIIRLTDKGRREAFFVDRRSREVIGRVVTGLTPPERLRLVRALNVVERLLGATPAQTSSQRRNRSVSGPDSPSQTHRDFTGLTKSLARARLGKGLAVRDRVTPRALNAITIDNGRPHERAGDWSWSDEISGARGSRSTSDATTRVSPYKRRE